MKLRHQIHGLLIFDTCAWCAWCPELDIMTQGDHPENAAAMLEDCIRVVVEDDLSDHRFTNEEPFSVRKKVTHPFRRGVTAIQDESWETFQSMLRLMERNGGGDSFSLDVLADGLDPVILVRGNLFITTRTGVAKIDPYLDDYGWVPAENFKVEYMQAYERKHNFTVRSSVIKNAGKGASDIIYAEAKIFARDPVGPLTIEKVKVGS